MDKRWDTIMTASESFTKLPKRERHILEVKMSAQQAEVLVTYLLYP